MNHKLQAIDMQGNKMINRFSNMMCWLVLVAAFIVVGCEQEHKEDALVYERLTDPNFVMPEYASRAIEATGGRQAWRNKKKLELDCVVTLYKPDGSFYLTEQHHEIYPMSNSIRISAEEPQGKFVWQLSGELFSVLEGAEQVDALPVAIENRDFAEAILNITTTPARLLDAFGFTKLANPVKKEGRWYYPIEVYHVKCGPDDLRGTSYTLREQLKAVFYQDRDSSLVDTICFAGAGEKKFFAIRGYDYKEVEKGSILVPTKIEIFRTDDTGALRERLVKINYYRPRDTQ